jgi:2-C-methyl-D-erythritol 4-phosphate cytidylyltransferase
VVEKVRAGADGAVPVVPILEVVQRVKDGRVLETVPKDELVLTQSPHAFRADVLRRLHADRPRPVENSGLLVANGYRVETVPGEPDNVHVTTPAELDVVRRLTLGRFGHGASAALRNDLDAARSPIAQGDDPDTAEGHAS